MATINVNGWIAEGGYRQIEGPNGNIILFDLVENDQPVAPRCTLEGAAADRYSQYVCCISAPQGTDPYLTNNSIQFHSHLGCRMVGCFTQCGYKFSRWYDMVWMEKHIGENTDKVEPVRFHS